MTNPTDSSSSFEKYDPEARPPQSEQDEKDASDALEYMHDVIDPELGINVVDLGLVYDVWIEHIDGIKRVVINMTLTTPACPLTDVLEEQTQVAIVNNGVADEVVVNWVWMPPWGPHMITEEGREQLRALGFAV
ncbi:metal-sulfur cluster assembly factor [Corynebacterium renale]|uniref:Metal-sulfur cluster biosynthetic enzyme n=1 Tax=Corynebacterium renale TaxID=1724 RepID=A0A2A9DRY5_9CORY|nr:metal-sulfur cluster assembly factor [Corynebacterium renale]PFG28690.1 metal-sulfur cluster biosynthetic enzyme [Corynebacterium renale]SQI26064.1 metal-sulfur cluster biosynthetic enzyme [Corynebacterium renale]